MLVQPVSNQPNFNGKLVLEKGTFPISKYIEPYKMTPKFKEIASIVAEKPYDIFISRNKINPDFFDVAANKSFKEAQQIKEYTVKIQSSIMLASIVDAAKDAMEMYEKYISRSIKG